MCAYEKSNITSRRHDAALRLENDLVALGRGELQRIGEPRLAVMHAAAVDVGVVEEVDTGGAGSFVQRADVGVVLVVDAHHSGDDGRGGG